MKKTLIFAILLAAAPSAAQADKGGIRNWTPCYTDFPGLGHLTDHFMRPCNVGENSGNDNNKY